MKTLIASAILAVGMAGAAAADPVLGIWKTEVDDGSYAHVEMYSCGERICGKFARTFNSEGEFQSANLGRKFVWDMAAAGDGTYSHDKSGRIWRPSNDKTYKAKMTLQSPDTLIVQGCLGPICPKQTWTRVN